MTPPQDSLKETIDELWGRIPREHGHPPVQQLDLDEFLPEHVAEEAARARRHLEPWITLSGHCLVWVSHLRICLEDVVAQSDRHRAAWALTGYASAHGLGVRNLVLSGLDSAARALLRTYIEALTVCLLCLDDQVLAEQFVAAQEPRDALRLWRTELSGQRLRDRLTTAVGARDQMMEEAFSEFLDWLNQEKSTYSQSVHASYVACALASNPMDIETGDMRPGFFGLATGASVRTLETLCKATWFFSRVLVPSLLGKGSKSPTKLRSFSPDEHFDGIVITGFYVLGELMVRYWEATTTAILPPEPEAAV